MINTAIYIADTLSAIGRFSIEAKRMRALGLLKPEGIGISDDLEKTIQKADGFSSKFEMLTALDKMEITYFPNINPYKKYAFKILVPEDKIAVINELAKNSGYVTVDYRDDT